MVPLGLFAHVGAVIHPIRAVSANDGHDQEVSADSGEKM